VRVLSKLRGPWSVLYWQQGSSTLWIGRDIMGGWVGGGDIMVCV
jgi:asparagine synthetase B (glutamine-hydrolysing)